MKRVLIIGLILAAAVGGSWAGYQYLTPAAPASATEDPTVEIVTADLETLIDSVSATGKIEPKNEVEMKFEIGGVVKEVLIERGQYVAKDAVLARLDTEDLELEVQRAQIELDQQQAELEKLFEPELAEEIASAQAQVESARLKLAELLDGPDPDEMTRAEAELSLKQVALKKAQWAYDEVAYRGDIGAMSQADALQEATLDYEIAQADYNLAVKEATQAEIAEARAALSQAQASLAGLVQDPSAADIASQQALVDKAHLTLQEKRNDLKAAVLVAPTAGVVLDVAIEPGERVLNEADAAAIVIANTAAYLLKVPVDEIDIGRIAIDQEAIITLDAFPDREFSGRVTDIAPSPIDNDSNGIVTFEVVVTLNAANDPGLLPGMTATAAIETRRLENVIVIPNRAVQIERAPEKSTVFVEKLDDNGAPMRIEVELGLRDGTVTQIVAGLEPGDEVLIRTQPELEGQPSL